METPRVDGSIQEIIDRLIKPRLSLLNVEFSRAGEAIIKELASVKTPLAELLHKGLGEEIVEELSLLIAEHDREQEESARRQMAEAVSDRDKDWEGKLAAAVDRAEESLREAAAEEAATLDSRWEERLASARSELEAAGQRKIEDALGRRDTEWRAKVDAAGAEAEQALREEGLRIQAEAEAVWQEKLARTVEEAETAWQGRLSRTLTDSGKTWQAKLAEALAARDAEWQSRLAASEAEIRQAMERQRAETLRTAEEAWRLEASRAEASRQEVQRLEASRAQAALEESWQGRLAEATARAEDAWRKRISAVAAFGGGVLASANQTEIMAHLVDAAAHFAGRVVLFITKDDLLVAWKTGGSAWKPAPPKASTISVPMSSATAVAAARTGLSACRGVPGDHAENGMLLDTMGGGRPERMVAVPVVVSGKVPAVLYADHRPGDPVPLDEETILYLVSLVQHRIEMIGLQRHGRGGEAGAGESAAASRPAPPKKSAPPAAEPRQEAPPPPPPAPEAPPAKTKAPAAPDAQVASAQKLARILITEIRLYNEKALEEARAGRTIYLALKRDIDVSREHYKSKVSKEASSRGDFFHEELVRNLCQGDASLLGKEYPGPVSA